MLRKKTLTIRPATTEGIAQKIFYMKRYQRLLKIAWKWFTISNRKWFWSLPKKKRKNNVVVWDRNVKQLQFKLKTDGLKQKQETLTVMSFQLAAMKQLCTLLLKLLKDRL